MNMHSSLTFLSLLLFLLPSQHESRSFLPPSSHLCSINVSSESTYRTNKAPFIPLPLSTAIRCGSATQTSPSPSQPSKLSTLQTRTISSLLMTGTLLTLIKYTKSKGIAALVLLTQVVLYKELTEVVRVREIDSYIPLMSVQRVLWFAGFVSFFTIGPLVDVFIPSSSSSQLSRSLNMLPVLSYTIATSSLVLLIVTLSTLPSLSPNLLKYHLSQASASVSILIFISQTSQILTTLTNAKYGLNYVTLPVLIVALNDTLAYVFGSLFGRYKLLVNISPNKTVEGYVLSGITTVLLTHVFITPYLSANRYDALAISIYASTIAPFAGFLASSLKRCYGVKNFGECFPGHGGVGDRVDCQVLMAGFVGVYSIVMEGGGE